MKMNKDDLRRALGAAVEYARKTNGNFGPSIACWDRSAILMDVEDMGMVLLTDSKARSCAELKNLYGTRSASVREDYIEALHAQMEREFPVGAKVVYSAPGVAGDVHGKVSHYIGEYICVKGWAGGSKLVCSKYPWELTLEK